MDTTLVTQMAGHSAGWMPACVWSRHSPCFVFSITAGASDAARDAVLIPAVVATKTLAVSAIASPRHQMPVIARWALVFTQGRTGIADRHSRHVSRRRPMQLRPLGQRDASIIIGTLRQFVFPHPPGWSNLELADVLRSLEMCGRPALVRSRIAFSPAASDRCPRPTPRRLHKSLP